MKKPSTPKKQAARKGRATKGAQFQISAFIQSGRAKSTVNGSAVHVVAPAIRNAAPKNHTVTLNTSGTLTERESTAFDFYLERYGVYLLPLTTRDFASAFGVSQSRAQQFFTAWEDAGRVVNVGNSAAKSYLPAESFSVAWQITRLIRLHGKATVAASLKSL